MHAWSTDAILDIPSDDEDDEDLPSMVSVEDVMDYISKDPGYGDWQRECIKTRKITPKKSRPTNITLSHMIQKFRCLAALRICIGNRFILSPCVLEQLEFANDMGTLQIDVSDFFPFNDFTEDIDLTMSFYYIAKAPKLRNLELISLIWRFGEHAFMDSSPGVRTLTLDGTWGSQNLPTSSKDSPTLWNLP
ncbi:hypothetical protein M422DRAFT_774656 [Sphaerobolus stellatus SS14]|nr:hypothetical protein M422DRAFT_774656 [Sphaerobolus stellatus SS14]